MNNEHIMSRQLISNSFHINAGESFKTASVINQSINRPLAVTDPTIPSINIVINTRGVVVILASFASLHIASIGETHPKFDKDKG